MFTVMIALKRLPEINWKRGSDVYLLLLFLCSPHVAAVQHEEGYA